MSVRFGPLQFDLSIGSLKMIPWPLPWGHFNQVLPNSFDATSRQRDLLASIQHLGSRYLHLVVDHLELARLRLEPHFRHMSPNTQDCPGWQS